MPGDPLWINANAGAPSYSANELRQAMALAMQYGGRAMGARQGVRPGGNQLQVSLAGSTISVQPGLACMDPALTTPQGPYWVALPAVEQHALTAADATNPRKDIVILRVYDHDEDASGLRLARSEYLTGVAGPAPAEPAVPAGAMRLATIDVPQSGGGAAVVTDRRTYTTAAGGILPVADATERNALGGTYDGLAVWRRDVDWAEVHNGAAWAPATPWRSVQTLGGNAAQITFSGIPSEIRSLSVHWTLRDDWAGFTGAGLFMRINNNAGAVYRQRYIQASGASGSALNHTAGNGLNRVQVGIYARGGSVAGHFASGKIEFPAWNAPHSSWLGFTWQSAFEEAANVGWHQSGGGIYDGAGPYTRIDLLPEQVGQNFVAGSQVMLIGWA